jgi:hypothetical protein
MQDARMGFSLNPTTISSKRDRTSQISQTQFHLQEPFVMITSTKSVINISALLMKKNMFPTTISRETAFRRVKSRDPSCQK